MNWQRDRSRKENLLGGDLLTNHTKIVRFRKKKKVVRVNQKQRRVIIVLLCIIAMISFVLFEIVRKKILS